MYYVYMLECTSKNDRITLYTGMTNDLERRFKQHESGKGARHTNKKRLKLVHKEEYKHHKHAFMRELEIKRMSLKEKRSWYAHE